MLSNENKEALTETQIATAFREANLLARRLATSLISFERNPDPMREREAPNPAHGVHIRILRPMVPVIVPVDEECKRHNDLVANLGVIK